MARKTTSLSVVGLVCAALFCTAPLSAQACFESAPTPSWAPFDVGQVTGGSSRPAITNGRIDNGITDGYQLCSISPGYGVQEGNDKGTDSFRFLFRLMRAHWRITGTLVALEGGGLLVLMLACIRARACSMPSHTRPSRFGRIPMAAGASTRAFERRSRVTPLLAPRVTRCR